ncbi:MULTISPECIES: PilX N-terminal domain-containing pilus assembly protein [Pseudomonas]|uniref:Pilus assembly protein PilX n=1 Tax=Pseudomonas poae TaxID=200451 RepID=A0AAP2RXB4_9PSED|nr:MULTISPECIES: PilX N-terminal domain-containing pilus assembly protein [Pseudomonas]ELQ16974.1 type IV pilus assembly protein PilX [Pseudomonas fluorescens BRIP34879]KTC34559.1 pilus assembly protein PilX [Pseudomonas sp. ABAC21]MBC3195434.1 pilus assembly protein PilX [Pseudomonas poae]MCF5653489.1 pilus assembly protein PilX [Pseudomonas poae]MCF5775870.1 pilus assembly protein PilX [Pseudomonas poae]
MAGKRALHHRQAGMVLLISLVFLLLLSLAGLSSMQGAVSQQKSAGSAWHRNQSLQRAESGLRLGESSLRRTAAAWPVCASVKACAPPQESSAVMGPGTHPVSTVKWIAMPDGVYGIQSLGPAEGLLHLPPHTPAALYRITAVGISGQVRTVLEAMYAQVGEGEGTRYRRVLWRQLH